MRESEPTSSLTATELRTRILYCVTISPMTRVEEVQERFTQTGVDYLLVMEEGNLKGLCSRIALGNLLGSRYGWSLFAHKPLGNLAQRPALLIKADEPIPEVRPRTFSREQVSFYDDVVFVDEKGKVEGCIPMRELIEFQNMMYQSQITELDEQRRLLETARNDAEGANLAESRFLANMSHEIRTPMNGVLGMTHLMLASELSLEQQEWLHVIQSSADALLILINDIPDLSKIEASSVTLEQVPFRTRDVIRETLLPHEQEANQKGVRLETVIDPQFPDIILGDPTRLRQVIHNPVGN